MKSDRILRTLLLLCLPVVALAETAAPLSPGEKVYFAALDDQHGNHFSHQKTMKLLLFVRGMETKELVQSALADIDKDCLTAGRVVYVADISKMPRLIAKMMAIPKMREYGYPVWLDRDGAATAALPVAEGAVSVIGVRDEAIVAVDYLKTVDALSQRLKGECDGL